MRGLSKIVECNKSRFGMFDSEYDCQSTSSDRKVIKALAWNVYMCLGEEETTTKPEADGDTPPPTHRIQCRNSPKQCYIIIEE